MSLFISDDQTDTLAENFQDTSDCSQAPDDPQASKKADLAGPGIGDYAELEKVLPACVERVVISLKGIPEVFVT